MDTIFGHDALREVEDPGANGVTPNIQLTSEVTAAQAPHPHPPFHLQCRTSDHRMLYGVSLSLARAKTHSIAISPTSTVF